MCLVSVFTSPAFWLVSVSSDAGASPSPSKVIGWSYTEQGCRVHSIGGEGSTTTSDTIDRGQIAIVLQGKGLLVAHALLTFDDVVV